MSGGGIFLTNQFSTEFLFVGNQPASGVAVGPAIAIAFW